MKNVLLPKMNLLTKTLFLPANLAIEAYTKKPTANTTMVDAYIGNVHFRLNYDYVYEEYDDDHFKDEYSYQYLDFQI